MAIVIRKFINEDLEKAIEIWNEVVEGGVAFPQIEKLNNETGIKFFLEQSYTGIAIDDTNNKILGLYILHPNNIGRCGHICNASYAVKEIERGKHIGEEIVKDCIIKGKELGFKILQFNAVVASNKVALNLYKKLGFTQLGTIPNGFLMKDGNYEDIIPHFYVL